MSAARVLNSVIFNDICKVHTAASMGVNLASCNRRVNHVKRDLFGHANPVETQKVFAEEQDKLHEEAKKKWNFDFRSDRPLSANVHFEWVRVSTQESTCAPGMYTLTRAAHLRPAPVSHTDNALLLDERAERSYLMLNNSNSTDTDSCGDDSQDESMPTATTSTATTAAAVFKVPVVGVCTRSASGNADVLNSLFNTSSISSSSCGKSPPRKRQPKITEYMKERKRLAQTPKKVSPVKRMRTNSGSNSSSHSHHHSTTHATSISAHFSLRRNNTLN